MAEEQPTGPAAEERKGAKPGETPDAPPQSPPVDDASGSGPAQSPPPPEQPSAPPPARTEETDAKKDRERDRSTYERFNRRVLIALLLVLAAVMVPMMRLFVAPLVLAFTFAALFYPCYAWFRRRFRGRKGLSALVCCIALLLGLLIPTYVLVHLVAVQTVDLYNTVEPKVREVVRKGGEGPLGKIREHQLVRWLRLQHIDWQSVLQETARAAGKFGSFVVNKTSVGILAITANLFVVFFTLFYLFRDGDAFLRRLRYLSPLRNEYEEMLFNRFLLISRASIKGTLVVGIVQGTLGSLVFLICGINTWLLWGFAMVALSLLPFTGAWFVMVPAGIIQLILGNIWQGVVILLACILVVSTIDNFLRPRLVGTAARMHDLIVFFATLGGISVFGVMGFIVGPVMAALFVTVLDIYGLEFRETLVANHTAAPPQQQSQ